MPPESQTWESSKFDSKVWFIILKTWSHISGMIPEDSPDIYLMTAANPNREMCGYKKNFKQSS